MIIAALYVEQTRKDTSRVVHYQGGSLKRAIALARELSTTCTSNAAWIIKGRKPVTKFYKGKRYHPDQTV